MLTDRQNFKLAFMSRCIEDGITTPAEIHERVKRAIDELNNGPEKQALVGEVLDFAGRLGGMALPIAFAAPPVLGAGAGYLAARATDVDDADIEEVKRQELIDELRRQTAKARRRHAVKDYRQTVAPFGRAAG